MKEPFPPDAGSGSKSSRVKRPEKFETGSVQDVKMVVIKGHGAQGVVG